MKPNAVAISRQGRLLQAMLASKRRLAVFPMLTYLNDGPVSPTLIFRLGR
jgi:hypothetical protein